MQCKSIFFLSLIPFSLSLWGTNYTWVGTTSNWSTDSNWSPNTGFPSTSADTATFSGTPTVATPNLSTTGITLNAILFSSTTTSIMITNGGNDDNLTFASNAGTSPSITMNSGVPSTYIYPPLVLDSNLTITQNNTSGSVSLLMGGAISNGIGVNGITLSGAGNVIFAGQNIYSGSTTVSAGTLTAGATTTFSPNSAFTVNSTLNLVSYNNTIANLSGSGTVTGLGGVLTITGGGAFSGAITNTIGLSLTGGTLALTGTSNSYTGPTTVSMDANLNAGASGALSPNSAVTLNDSAGLNITGAFSNSIESLTGDPGTTVNIGTSGLLTIASGGTFQGIIGGAGALTLNGGTLALSNANTYSGATTISNASLLLNGSGSILDSSSVALTTATFDISGITSSTTVNNLSGNGASTVSLGTHALTVNTTTNETFSGNITGTTGSLITEGSATFTLSGNNSYGGTTTVTAGTLQAGSTTAFSPTSAFTVNSGATLGLQTFNNTIGSLFGAGNVTTAGSGGGTLTITNGGSFSGVMSNSGALVLNGGTLTLSGVNTYTGGTTINGILDLSGSGALASTGPVVVNGTFDISGITTSSRTIGTLSGGTSSANGTINLGANELIVAATGNAEFYGVITGMGGQFNYNPASALTLTLGASGSNYTGTTTVSNGTLAAGIANAFSPGSAYVVNGTLSLAGFANTIDGLSGSGTVSLGAGLLTLNAGGTFSGGITGSGGVTLTSGTLALTTASSANTYTGPTTINNAILQAGVNSVFSSTSAFTLQNNGQFNLTGAFSDSIGSLNGDATTFVNLASGSTLTITPNTAGSTFAGAIQGAGALTLNGGTLALSNANTYSGATTISNASLLLNGSGSILDSSSVTLTTATFDISGITSSTTVNNLSGNGASTVSLGTHALTVNTTTNETFSGNITGTTGSLITEGSATFTLSGNNSYGGTTTVTAGTLQAGSTTAFSPTSAFTVNSGATLGLQTFNNTIGSLFGAGNVTTAGSGGGTLTITNGGSFSGVMSNSGALVLNGGTLTLSGVNTYTGGTTINGILDLSGSGALASTGPVVVNGTFDISGITTSSRTIGTLSGGTSSANGTINLGANELIVAATGNAEFYGVITGMGGQFNYNPASALTLTLGASGSNYTGTTTVSNGTLAAGIANAFSPGSAYVVNGTLSLAGFANTIDGLSGSGTVSLGAGLLTLNAGGTFSGGITGSGGVTLTSGTLALTTASSANTYTGPTTINNAILQAGVNSAFSSTSAFTLQNNGQFNLTGAFSDSIGSLNGDATTFVNLASGSTLTITPNTAGSTFAGAIQGAGSLALNGGILQLSGDNSFTGTATVTTGTLELLGTGRIDTASSVIVNGTLDISRVTASTTVNNLNGSGSVLLGAKELFVNLNTTPQTFSGNITGTTGSLATEGTGTLILSGTNGYLGPTIVTANSTLQAGATNTFASLSDFTVDGTLALQTFSNTINSLSGAGNVTATSSASTLTINNGGNFSGRISGSGALTLAGGTLALSGTDTYSGATLVANNTTLLAGSTTALSPNSNMTVTGTLNLNNWANTVLSLSGGGTVNTGTMLNAGILTVSNGGIFSGDMIGLGGLNLTGGTLQLSIASLPNTYSGSTTLSNSAILLAEATNAFSPYSDYTLNGSSKLDLNGFSNTISSLTSSSASTNVSLGSQAILTINGGKTTTFAGTITNSPCGGLTISGGTNLTLTNSGNNYCGPTSILNGTLQIENGALSPLTDVTISSSGTLNLLGPTANAANSVVNSGLLYSQDTLTLATTYTQNSGSTLNLQFETGSFGKILATTGISIGTGTTLVVSAAGSYPTSGGYTLLSTTSGIVVDQFSIFTPTPSGFAALNPLLSYSLQSVDLFFASCVNSWTKAANGNWGDGTNWGGGCIPGANGNQNDVANFPTVGTGAVTVFLEDQSGAPESFTLFQLNLNSATTSYTINELSNATTITFDSTSGGTPQINVMAGDHVINAPLILNQSTELVLTDSTQLTFASDTTLTSQSTQNFTIRQSNSSTTGSGLLVNDTTLAPYSMSIVSATVENNDVIAPLNSLTIGPIVTGQTVIVTNSGAEAQIGPSLPYGSLQIGGAGTTIVTNSGIDATFGPSGNNGSLQIGGAGTTTITNNGPGAIFGLTALGGNLTIDGSGPTSVVNTGQGVKLGAFGRAGNVTVTSGTVYNESGAVFQAGPGGVLTINGGTVINDLTSTVGSYDSSIVFSSGLLNNNGKLYFYDFTQTGPTSNLYINLDNIPTILGNLDGVGTFSIGNGSTLTVNALPGSVSSPQTTVLVYAQRGVLGTYSNVDFLNFPAGFIPDIIYTPNAVELVTAPTVTPNSLGSLGDLLSASIGEINFLVQRELHDLHGLIIERKKKKKKKKNEISQVFEANQFLALADEPHSENILSQTMEREQHLLTERVIEEESNPSRFYFGPIDNFGRFQKRSLVQQAFGFNSVGVFTGIDHAFENFGLGLEADYEKIKGKVDHHDGKFHVHQIHANAYATWVPSALENLAVDAIVGYGYDWFDIHRKAGAFATTTTAKSNTQGMLTDALLGGEYIFSNDRFQRMPQNIQVTPFLNAQYIGVWIDGFKEHSAGVYDLKVQSQHINSLRSTLGTRWEYIARFKNFTFKPEIDVAWQYEFMDHKRKIDFTTLHLAQNHTVSENIFGAGRNTLLLGVDFLFTIYKVFELELSYDFQWNNLYTNHAVYLGLGGNF